MSGDHRKFDAIIWRDGTHVSGLRVSVIAKSLAEAKAKLEATYGPGNVFDLHNKEDAEAPR
jgi:hypothetical protein